MTESESAYNNFAAPKQHGELLLVPDWDSACRTLTARHVNYDQPLECDFESSFLNRWRPIARTGLLRDAVQYTASYRDVPDISQLNDRPIVLAGHQPELFHCGVWYKNFLLSQLGKKTGAIAINFIVDNDLCRSTGIQVPYISADHVSNQIVHFDQPESPRPWENRKLLDADCWRTFADRVMVILPKQSGHPLVHQLWPFAQQMNLNQSLGLLLSQARHRLEEAIGLRTLEVPLSTLCRSDAFAAFSLQLLSHLEALRESYNSELTAYRQAHRIRNHAQPLPNLEMRDGWFEMPWWCYTEDSQRNALWAKKLDDGNLVLSDLNGWQVQLDGPLSRSSALEQWMLLESQGMRLRPRALITTMFARLMLSDLFVHGIGGGKYDQITDRIISSLFRIPPPPMVVASATMRLQLKELPRDLKEPLDSKIQQAQQLLNTLTTNPEHLLEHFVEGEVSAEKLQALRSLTDQKRTLLNAIPDKGEKWEWHVAMKKIKQQFSIEAAPLLEARKLQIQRWSELAAQQSLIQSREYSYCLFPVDEVLACLGAQE